MQSINVRLPQANYDILVGHGLLNRVDDYLESAGLKPPYLLISQPRIIRSVGSKLRKKFPTLLIPDGERAKSLRTVEKILDRMASLHLTRQSTLIALGGGVVGDVSGFAASIYMRGIAVVQIPTTLLAQVDSSIGGKTGVNHRVAKNMIGTFHQPSLVIADQTTLRTLPGREYSSGLYEALKYGIIHDARLFEDFEHSIAALQKRDGAALERLVGRCAAIKAEVVMADEKEDGLRRILNFGHTIGHALEAALNYSRIKHGEAVGYGMIAASKISSALQMLPTDESQRIQQGVALIGKLPSLRGVRSKAVLEALIHDKKVRDGVVHFVLPRRIGEVEVTPHVPLQLVADVVKEMLHGRK